MMFLAALIVELAIGIVPGFLFLRSLGLSCSHSFCFSTAASIFLLCVSATVLSFMKIYGAVPVLVLVGALIAVICLIRWSIHYFGNLAGAHASAEPDILKHDRFPMLISAASIVFACAVVAVMYFQPIGQFDAFIQFDDNATHLATIEANSRTGNYSPLISAYNLPDDPNGTSTGSYYPGGFHLVPALVCAITGCNAALAENAAVILFCCVAYPVGMTLVLFEASGRNKLVAAAAVPTSLGSLAFPIRMLAVHGPFPNIAGFSLVPLFVGSILLAWRHREHFSCTYLVPVLVGAISLAFLHPNALIFGCVFVFPFVLVVVSPQVSKYICDRFSISIRLRCCITGLICALLIVLALCVWCFVHGLSFMKPIVTFIWAWSPTLDQLLSNILSGGLLLGIPQYVFAGLCFLGLVRVLKSSYSSWLALSFLEFGSMYVLAGIGSTALKSLVSGFWYTDPERLAAMLGISMASLAPFGLALCSELVGGFLGKCFARMSKGLGFLLAPVPWVMLVGFAAAFVHANYAPLEWCVGMPADTAWSQNCYELNRNYAKAFPNLYTEEERSFVLRVKALVGDDLVLNHPYDGSTFAYSVDGLNLFYPYRTGVGESETSYTIRHNLNQYSTNELVQKAVKKTGARWILLLGQEDFTPSSNGKWLQSPCGAYRARDWSGFLGLSEVPGKLDLALQEGSCRLFKVL